MGAYLAIPAGILGAVLQSALMPHLRILGGTPNLVLVVLITWVLLVRTQDGIVFALSAGVALDTISSAPFGLAMVALTIVALLAGLVGANMFRAAWYLPYVSVTVGTLVYGLLGIMALQAVGRLAPVGLSMRHAVLPELVPNLVLMAIVYELAHALARFRRRGEIG